MYRCCRCCSVASAKLPQEAWVNLERCHPIDNLAAELSTLMETRRVCKATDKMHNPLEASVLEHYKDQVIRTS